MTTPLQENSQAETPKDNKELNFEKVRKQLEQERAGRIAAEDRASKLEQERATQARKPYKEDDDDIESDEPYVDHKVLNRKLAKFGQDFEKKVDQLAEQKARSLIEQDKQQNYVKQNPDFQQVLTQENIQQFAEKHPAIAERMLRMPDSFDRQALLYEQIKVFQTNKKEEQKPSIQSTIDQNRRGPYYQPSGIGSSPYASAGDFSPSGQKNAYTKLQELKSKLRL
jgi:hypothetical protein